MSPDLPLFRGPPVADADLKSGNYFCVMGAAQTFGRLVRRPWPFLLGDALGLPALSLSRGGAGPEFFLEPRMIELAQNAQFVILQVMSGRSVGCEEYPGGRRITRDGQNTKLKRLDLLKDMWQKDREVAIDYVHRWNENYVALYAKIRRLIDRPTLLLWISDRAPNDWDPSILRKKFNTGSFPQLIGRKTYRAVVPLFDAKFQEVTGVTMEQPLSRVTGEACPYFGDSGANFHSEFHYYPSTASNYLLAQALLPWARTAFKRSNRMAMVDAPA